ncbi:hypothetical protein BDCR2A_01576 [Borrelia duttonii CR2A]|uniref:Uncharacterized protein n=1 Tax=Borrelia duttonii CR2A TaxID=1432657 RepID=W6TJX5_9SPIR|nr:hypothetical protein BDCR2A_01576 [Borrelia duttonii CR2A]
MLERSLKAEIISLKLNLIIR